MNIIYIENDAIMYDSYVHNLPPNCAICHDGDRSYVGMRNILIEHVYLHYHDWNDTYSIDMFTMNTSYVRDMSCLYADMYKLQKINYYSKNKCTFITDKVTNMKNMFHLCLAIKNIKMPNTFNSSNITDMSCMFSYCRSLRKVNLYRFNTVNVRDMSHMFYRCLKLPSIDLSKCDTRNVTDMKFMFQYCLSIKQILFSRDNIPSSHKKAPKQSESNFVTSNVTDMRHMFCNCPSLKHVNISTFDTSKVKNMSYMFFNCISLVSCSRERITIMDLSHFNTSNVTDMACMFYRCKSLKSLKFNVDMSKVKRMDLLFYGCKSLRDLDLSGAPGSKSFQSFNLSSLESDYNIFGRCKQLNSLTIYDCSVKDIEYILSNISSSRVYTNVSINLPNYVFNAGVYELCS